MSRKLYRMLANDLGDAVYATRVAGTQDERIMEELIADVAVTLYRCNTRFVKAKFMEAIEDRVRERADELIEKDRRAQMEGY